MPIALRRCLWVMLLLMFVGVSAWGMDGEDDPDPSVTIEFNVDRVYLADDPRPWREAEYTVTPASRLSEVLLDIPANAEDDFEVLFQAVDAAAGRGRVRVRPIQDGPKSFDAKLRIDGNVLASCKFQSVHLTTVGSIDIQNDATQSAPLEIAAQPAAERIRSVPNDSGLAVEHPTKGSVLGGPYAGGFKFRPAGTEDVFASPADDTAQTRVVGRVLVRYPVGAGFQEVMYQVPAVGVTVWRGEVPPWDWHPAIQDVEIKSSLNAMDSSGVLWVNVAERVTFRAKGKDGDTDPSGQIRFDQLDLSRTAWTCERRPTWITRTTGEEIIFDPPIDGAHETNELVVQARVHDDPAGPGLAGDADDPDDLISSVASRRIRTFMVGAALEVTAYTEPGPTGTNANPSLHHEGELW